MRAEDVPAFLEELERWARERDGAAELVEYGDHDDQVIELRRPTTTGPHPLAMVLHGGFWRAGYTRRSTTALAVALADAGWASANVEYRRLGAGAYRAMLDSLAHLERDMHLHVHKEDSVLYPRALNREAELAAGASA